MTAWNAGQVRAAEEYARQALGRSPAAEHARAVLIEVAAHDAKPLLHVAALLSTPKESANSAAACYQAGEIAFQQNYAAIAEQAWEAALAHEKRFAPAYDRLIGLAALRLDSERALTLLERRADQLPPNEATIRLLMGAESLHTEAATMRQRLRAFVEKDPSDAASRAGLARCMIHLGQPEDALTLLKEDGPAYERLTRAQAYLETGRIGDAREAMPPAPPPEQAGTHWILDGLIALADGRVASAGSAFEQAITLRPLNRELRSAYAELLRRQGEDERNAAHARKLSLIQQIELYARDPSSRWTDADLGDLIERCQTIGAPEYVRQLRMFRERPERSMP